MKKIIVFLFPFLVTYAFAQDSSKVYKLSFRTIDSSNIAMSRFEGKQILIVEFDASNPDRLQLSTLDSVYRSRSSTLQIIGIPVNNSNTILNTGTLLQLLRDTLGVSFILSDIGKARKSANSNQHPLLKWVTHLSSNNHLDNDIGDEGRIFILSETGTLYASLRSATSINGTILQKALDNPPSAN